MLHHLDDVGRVLLEIEETLVEGDVARVDPIGDEDLKAGRSPMTRSRNRIGK